MVLEASMRYALAPRKVLEALKRHPERIRSLRVCTTAIKSLAALHVQILPVTSEILLASQTISEHAGLLTNDALIVATMREHGLRHLATNDRDFLRVADLTLWHP